MRLGDAARGCELVEGRLLRMPPTGLEHSDIAGNVYVALRGYVKAHALGDVTMPETGFIVSQAGEPDTVLAPDVAFIAAGRLPEPGTSARRAYQRIAPDLVVEVVSPGQYGPEMVAKARRWLMAGVRLVWVVWPTTHTVDIWRFSDAESAQTEREGDLLVGEPALPGFTLPVTDIFR